MADPGLERTSPLGVRNTRGIVDEPYRPAQARRNPSWCNCRAFGQRGAGTRPIDERRPRHASRAYRPVIEKYKDGLFRAHEVGLRRGYASTRHDVHEPTGLTSARCGSTTPAAHMLAELAQHDPTRGRGGLEYVGCRLLRHQEIGRTERSATSTARAPWQIGTAARNGSDSRLEGVAYRQVTVW
jgi:hypothetical protein